MGLFPSLKIAKDGSKIQNANKTGDKYKRQVWDKPALSVHTRNDQLVCVISIHRCLAFSTEPFLAISTEPDLVVSTGH